MRHALLAILFCGISAVQAQSVPSIAAIDIQLAEQQSLPLDDEISFRVLTQKADDVVQLLENWEGIKAHKINADAIDISMVEQPTYVGEVYDKYSISSFVIDTDQEVIKQLVLEFVADLGEDWKPDQLIRWVNNYIDNPSYIHGFNIASLVAKQRSGDCTEHAVLVTALARSLGMPSKVMAGAVLLEFDEGVMAFGHAWSEVWINGQWQILDASLYDSTAIKHFYLPSGELENEGPGFGISLFSLISRNPVKITQVRNTNLK